MSRDGLVLGRIGAPGYRAHRSACSRVLGWVGIIFAAKLEKW